MTASTRVEEIRRFWDQRAGLGQWAGTRDVIAKSIEIESIAKHAAGAPRILDVGCGNGITAIELARRYDVNVVGVDFAAEMIAAARLLCADTELRGRVEFRVGDVLDLSEYRSGFDLAYTERTLINLRDWPSQQEGVRQIASALRPSGRYVMVENSQDGLDRINELRMLLDLPAITPPWHNRYLRDAEVRALSIPGLRLERVEHHSSTYYFISRVLNAWLAATESREPDYESALNRLALRLPPIGEMGQGKTWLWRKVA